MSGVVDIDAADALEARANAELDARDEAVAATWRCLNCDAKLGGAVDCPDCHYPITAPRPDRSKPLCSICRRRHGTEKIHAAE